MDVMEEVDCDEKRRMRRNWWRVEEEETPRYFQRQCHR